MEAGECVAAGAPAAAHSTILRSHLIDAFKGLQNEHEFRQAGGDLDFKLESGFQATQDVIHTSGCHQSALLNNADRGAEVLHLREDVTGNEDGATHGVKLLDELAELESAGGIKA